MLWCVVYTRKSTEAGLEQEFNSLDAQREACEATTHDPVLPVLLETTVAEMRTEGMGSATVLSRLADIPDADGTEQ
jgi:hypothetical protein